jgi:hypothetical protein
LHFFTTTINTFIFTSLFTFIPPQATVELQLQFLRALRDSLSDADYVPIAFNVREVVTENPEAEQGEEGQGEGMEEEE